MGRYRGVRRRRLTIGRLIGIAFRPFDWPTWARRLYLLLAPFSVPLWIASVVLLITAAVAAPFIGDIVEFWEAKPRRRYRYARYDDGGSTYLRIRRTSVSRPLPVPTPAADLAIRYDTMGWPGRIAAPLAASAGAPPMAAAA